MNFQVKTIDILKNEFKNDEEYFQNKALECAYNKIKFTIQNMIESDSQYKKMELERTDGSTLLFSLTNSQHFYDLLSEMNVFLLRLDGAYYVSYSSENLLNVLKKDLKLKYIFDAAILMFFALIGTAFAIFQNSEIKFMSYTLYSVYFKLLISIISVFFFVLSIRKIIDFVFLFIEFKKVQPLSSNFFSE